MNARAITEYKKQAVSTMSPGEQLVLLLDEALKCLRGGILLSKEAQYDAARAQALRCRNIIEYLSSVLDFRYPIAGELAELYRFIRGEVLRFDFRADPAILEGVLPLTQTLRDTWAESERLIHINRHR